jgi:prophage DNA circulation protein
MSWKDRLLPASFRGVPFHYETVGEGGGRRNVPFPYPKKDEGFVEDMGRKIKPFSVEGYVIGENYVMQKEMLKAALDAPGSGLLTLPFSRPMRVICDSFDVQEQRAEGGFASFTMTFLEAGRPAFAAPASSSSSAVTGASKNASTATKSAVTSKLVKGGRVAKPSASVSASSSSDYWG